MPADTKPDTAAESAETAEETVTAAAAPSFAKDQVVTLPASLGPGLVASVDGDRAIVTVEVPLADLQDAGPEGRAALSASARERLADEKLASAISRIEEMETRMESVVASAVEREQAAEAKQRGAVALAELADVPGADAAGN